MRENVDGVCCVFVFSLSELIDKYNGHVNEVTKQHMIPLPPPNTVKQTRTVSALLSEKKRKKKNTMGCAFWKRISVWTQSWNENY